jgi:hypothetical protein
VFSAAVRLSADQLAQLKRELEEGFPDNKVRLLSGVEVAAVVREQS